MDNSGYDLDENGIPVPKSRDKLNEGQNVRFQKSIVCLTNHIERKIQMKQRELIEQTGAPNGLQYLNYKTSPLNKKIFEEFSKPWECFKCFV